VFMVHSVLVCMTAVCREISILDKCSMETSVPERVTWLSYWECPGSCFLMPSSAVAGATLQVM